MMQYCIVYHLRPYGLKSVENWVRKWNFIDSLKKNKNKVGALGCCFSGTKKLNTQKKPGSVSHSHLLETTIKYPKQTCNRTKVPNNKPSRIIEDIIAKYAFDANLFRLGSTNPRKNPAFDPEPPNWHWNRLGAKNQFYIKDNFGILLYTDFIICVIRYSYHALPAY